MRPLIYATIQVALFFMILSVILIAAHFVPALQSPYQKYARENRDMEIYVGNALGATEDGVKAELSNVSKNISTENPSKIALLAVDFLNIKISYTWATILSYYTFIVVIEGILCYLLGASYIFTAMRGKSIYDPIARAVVDKYHVYIGTDHHPGEDLAITLTFIVWMFKLIFIFIWGLLLPVIVLAELVLQLLFFIFGYIYMKFEDLREMVIRARNKNKGVDVWSRGTSGKLYYLTNDGHPENKIFFRRLINAYVFEGLIKADSNNQVADSSNMDVFIRFNLPLRERVRRKISKMRQSIFLLVKSKKREVCSNRMNVVRKMQYNIQTDTTTSKHLVYGAESDIYFTINKLTNLALAMYFLGIDSSGAEITSEHWNEFAHMPREEKENLIVGLGDV